MTQFFDSVIVDMSLLIIHNVSDSRIELRLEVAIVIFAENLFIRDATDTFKYFPSYQGFKS